MDLSATTLPALKAYLGISSQQTDKDELLTLLMQSCTDAAEKYTGRFFVARPVLQEPHDCQNAKSKYIQLEQYPVTAITKIMQDGQELSADAFKADAYNGIIKKACGHWHGIIMADYSAGLAPDAQSVPKNIQLAIWQWVADILQMQQNGGLKSEGLGDYNVTYYDEHKIPASAAMLLDCYRKVSV